MTRQRLFLGGLFAALMLGLGYFLYTQLEWHETTRRTGYSKAARLNPFHAGQLLLDRLGYPADASEDLSRLDTLPTQSTLLLGGKSMESFAAPDLRRKLLGWVERGGHLVLPIDMPDTDSALLKELGIQPRATLSYDDDAFALELEGHSLTTDLTGDTLFDVTASVLWRIDLRGRYEITSSESEEVILKFHRTGKTPRAPRSQACPAPESDAAETEEIPAVDPAPPAPAEQDPITKTPEAADEPAIDGAAEEEEPEIILSDEETRLTAFARIPHGKGFITTGSFSAFRNHSIDDHDHAPLFVRLMTLPDARRPVLMLLAPDYPGLLEWLAQRAPEALLGLALLIAAMLWRIAPRFGPLLPEPAPDRPGLREHLAASGNFLLRQRAYEALIAPLREDVLRHLEHLQHRHPEIEGRERLGEHLSGIKATEIARALTPTPETHHEFLRRCQTLATLHACCKRLRQTSFGTSMP